MYEKSVKNIANVNVRFNAKTCVSMSFILITRISTGVWDVGMQTATFSEHMLKKLIL